MTKFFRRATSTVKASASFSLSPQRGEGWGEGWEGSCSAADSHIFFLEICREFGGHKNFVLHPPARAQPDPATVWSSAFTRSRVRSAIGRLKAELQTPNLIDGTAMSRCTGCTGAQGRGFLELFQSRIDKSDKLADDLLHQTIAIDDAARMMLLRVTEYRSQLAAHCQACAEVRKRIVVNGSVSKEK
jgi:hypothetical protein